MPIAKLEIDIERMLRESPLSIAEIARRAGLGYFQVYDLLRLDRRSYNMVVLGSVLYALGVRVSEPFKLSYEGEKHVARK